MWGEASAIGELPNAAHDVLGLPTRIENPVRIFGSYWAFDPTSFDIIADDIANRPLPDDRLIALTLAFRLFVVGGRPRKWRERLKRLAAKEEALRVKLDTLLHPPAGELAKYRRQETQWKRRDARISAAREKRLEQDKTLLAERVDQIRYPGNPSALSAGLSQHQFWRHSRASGFVPVGDSSRAGKRRHAPGVRRRRLIHSSPRHSA